MFSHDKKGARTKKLQRLNIDLPFRRMHTRASFVLCHLTGLELIDIFWFSMRVFEFYSRVNSSYKMIQIINYCSTLTDQHVFEV